METETRSPEETEAAGAALARRLSRGDLVLVGGELGSGKTTFVRGACRALGVGEAVTSPTFTIGQLYRGEDGEGELEVAHLDLYRVTDLGTEEPGLLDDYLTPERIAFVELPHAARFEPGRQTARVAIRHAGGDARRLRIT